MICSGKGKKIPQNKTKREQNTTYTWEVADDLKLAVNHMACLDQSIPRSFLEFHQPPCRHRENKSAQTKIRSSRSKALEERGKYHEKESSVHLLERAKYGEVRQAFWQNGSALAVCASAVEQEEEMDQSSSSRLIREKRVGASHGSPRPEASPVAVDHRLPRTTTKP
jgi:hypothetical protein